jgi:hypothetical protein
MSQVRPFIVIVASAIVVAASASAQTSNRPELRLGVGTFLSRDGGWNYTEQTEVFAAVAQNIGSFNVEAGGSFFKSYRNFIYPAMVPRPPRAFHDGFAGRLHVRTPNARTSAFSAIVGAEVFQNRTDDEERLTTAAGTAGVGFNFGSGRRGSLDLRYVRFAKPLGSSRGILPLTLSWRL